MKQTPAKLKLNNVPPFLTKHAPTEPLTQYFDPSKTSLEYELFASTLNEFVRFGTHILLWFRQEYWDKKFCNAISGLFIEQLQRTDSLAAMFKTGAYSSTPIILRSMTEIFLQMKYIMHSDSERRAMSLQYMGKIRRVELLDELLKSTQKGKNIRELLKKDKSGGKFNLGGDEEEKELQRLREEMNSINYAEIHAEYNRLTSERNGKLEWYKLFNGPNELRGLAESIGETGIYYMCYRKFHEYVHGTQRFREEEYFKKKGASNNGLEVRPFDGKRLFDEVFLVVFRNFMFILDHTHVNPSYFRDWAISCKLLELPGFENYVINGPNGQELDIHL